MAKKQPSRKQSESPDLSYIVEPLRPLAVELDALQPDERNARKHDKKNLAAIKSSLKRYGQRQPLVVNKSTGTILAGNARYTVAKDLGWSHAAVVYVEDSPTEATGYAIADNRTAELAEWDDAQLLELLAEIRAADEQHAGDEDLVTDLQFDSLLADLDAPQKSNEQAVPELWQVVANCSGEESQKELYDRLKGEGYDVKLLVI